MPGWTDWALEAAKWMIGECLKNPIHAGEIETTEEPEGETSEHVPASATYQQGISGIGKSSIYYKKSGATEILDISFNGMVGGTNSFNGVLKRSGLGASSEYHFTKSNSNFNSVVWQSGTFANENIESNYGYSADTLYAGYKFGAGSCTYETDSGSQSTVNFHPTLISTSENQIPTYFSASSTILSPFTVCQYYYAENTFYSNCPTYISNHTLNSVSNNYFNAFEIPVSVVNAYIPSNTNINVNNYQNYADYGYYVNNDGDVDIDMNVLAAYLQGVLKAELEAAYKNFYINFPEPGATVGDDDITYINPFGDEEEDPTEGTAGQIQPFSIDYNEILGEEEMESIIAETRYVLDTTPYEIESLDYQQAISEPYEEIKKIAVLDSDTKTAMSKIYDVAERMTRTDFLPLYAFSAIISIIMWFVFRR